MKLYKDNLGKVSITIEKDYWDINKDYDKLTVVEKEGTFGTYISRKPVPTGIVLTDREYWIPFSSLKEEIVIDYNSFIDRYSNILEDHENRLVDVEKLKDSVENLILNTDAIIDDTNELLIKVRQDIETANETLRKANEIINSFDDTKKELDNFINTKGEPNGLATLDSTGKVPSKQLPSYVDDVVEYDTFSSFPHNGEDSKIYVAKDTNRSYRWSGSIYIELTSGVVLGTTSTTAYPGDKGQQNANNISSINTKLLNIPSKLITNIEITEGDDHSIAINEIYKERDVAGQWSEKIENNTLSTVTNEKQGLMHYNDKAKLDNLPTTIMVRPELDETSPVSAIDNGVNVAVFNTSLATYNTNNCDYVVSNEQPLTLPKFTFIDTLPGVIDSGYAAYLKNLIYEHRLKGNVATAELSVTQNKVSLKTSVVQPVFNSDYTHITDSVIVPVEKVIPTASSVNVGLMSASDFKIVNTCRRGIVHNIYYNSETNSYHYSQTETSEGLGFSEGELGFANATTEVRGFMSAEDKKVVDKANEMFGTGLQDGIANIEFNQYNQLTFVRYPWNHQSGAFDIDPVAEAIYPTNATSTVAGYMSAEDKVKLDGINISNYYTKTDINSVLLTKANVTDLSNVLGVPTTYPFRLDSSAMNILLKDRSSNTTLYPITTIDRVIGSEELNNRITELETKLELEDEKPTNDIVQFIIDQRYVNSLSDSDKMVSNNFIVLDKEGNKIDISSSGSTGKPEYNCLSWLKANTHAYLGRYVNGVVRLKQLDDTNRRKFSDGTSSLDYITNENGEYDVWMKINSDVYYKTEAAIPPEATEPDEDYVLVSIARKLPIGEDITTWQKWSQYNLVGVYKACRINNKLHSLSGKCPVNNISQINAKSQARARGEGFRLVTYDFSRFLAYLFYGYYSHLNSQEICGFGTTNIVNSVYYPKITGQTDKLSGVDTNKQTGSGLTTVEGNEDVIIAGEGLGIVSNNFWQIENFQGDIYEWLDDMQVMQAKRPESVTSANPNIYLSDYVATYGYPIVTKTGKDYQLTAELLEAMDENQRFIAISDINGDITRIIQHGDYIANSEGWIKKMCFGSHADIIAKEFGGVSSNNGFSDYGVVYSAGHVALRSYVSSYAAGGVGCLYLYFSAGGAGSRIGSRLLYEGNEDNVIIIDDPVEMF